MSMICTCKIWQRKRPKVLNQTLRDLQGYLQTYPEPLCQVWKSKTLNSYALGIDVLEILDADGAKYQVLNMISLLRL